MNSPKFSNPGKDLSDIIDSDSDLEITPPSEAVLNKVAGRFSPKKSNVFDKIKTPRSLKVRKSPKRAEKKKRRSRKSPKRSKVKSPKRRRSRKI